MMQVAVIGAGPAGLCSARWLKREGFEPVVFEQGARLGGQWSADPAHSGVWNSMRTNTCRDMTQFSDMPHAPGTPLYPSHRQMLAYLEAYAANYDLLPCIRLRTRVLRLSRRPDGTWALRTAGREGAEAVEAFSHVVICTGRFTKPRLPAIPGLDSFCGDCGVAHTFQYRAPHRYEGRRVLVGGCAVSALEIACDLATSGMVDVTVANRRQRYVMQKIVAGVPVEHLIQTRAAALVHEQDASQWAMALKRTIVATSGHPKAFGAAEPDADLVKAGVTQCQQYLPLLAEGRIRVKPWASCVTGRKVTFTDGRTECFDGLIFGTGFDLDLPFVEGDLRRQLGLGRDRLRLFRCTFHPDLPGLAVAGQFQVSGPYFPPIELQARWIAYAWSGARPLRPPAEMRAIMDAEAHLETDKHHMPLLCLQFAREAGVEPDLAQWPEIEDALAHGPLTAMSFRLSGRDSMLEAAAYVRRCGHVGREMRAWLQSAALVS